MFKCECALVSGTTLQRVIEAYYDFAPLDHEDDVEAEFGRCSITDFNESDPLIIRHTR